MIGYVGPRTKYQTEVIAVVREDLSIFDRSNQALLKGIAKNFVDMLLFFETGRSKSVGQATVHINLAAMVTHLTLTKPA